MRRQLVYNIRQFFANKAVVLMYHRIAEPASDVWEIAVSPQNFELHLQVLKQVGNIVSLDELSHRIKTKTLRRNSIAITFDDGYPDNLEVAMPLLEKYKVPATFFITSGNIDTPNEFWWDELEQLVLFTEQLPRNISLKIGDTTLETNLGDEMRLSAVDEQKHRDWKACTEPPPTGRAILFYKIWESLKPLPHRLQQQHMEQVRALAKSAALTRPGYRTMSRQELQALARSKQVTIAAHTVTHPALAYHSSDYQQKEILANKETLQEVIAKKIDLLSYPFGNFNDHTIDIVSKAGFTAAFSTEEVCAQNNVRPYKLGRFQVKNLSGEQLSSQLKIWKSQTQ